MDISFDLEFNGKKKPRRRPPLRPSISFNLDFDGVTAKSWEVLKLLKGREALSSLYSYEFLVQLVNGTVSDARGALGQRVHIKITNGSLSRDICGVIMSVEAVSVPKDQNTYTTNYKWVVRPELAKACYSRRHRVWQNAEQETETNGKKWGEEVIRGIVYQWFKGEVVISSAAQEAIPSSLLQLHQNDESDYNFFARLLSSWGLGYKWEFCEKKEKKEKKDGTVEEVEIWKEKLCIFDSSIYDGEEKPASVPMEPVHSDRIASYWKQNYGFDNGIISIHNYCDAAISDTKTILHDETWDQFFDIPAKYRERILARHKSAHNNSFSCRGFCRITSQASAANGESVGTDENICPSPGNLIKWATSGATLCQNDDQFVITGITMQANTDNWDTEIEGRNIPLNEDKLPELGIGMFPRPVRVNDRPDSPDDELITEDPWPEPRMRVFMAVVEDASILVNSNLEGRNLCKVREISAEPYRMGSTVYPHLWVELASPHADANSGIFARPRKDNVLICLDRGDMSIPLALGAMFRRSLGYLSIDCYVESLPPVKDKIDNYLQHNIKEILSIMEKRPMSNPESNPKEKIREDVRTILNTRDQSKSDAETISDKIKHIYEQCFEYMADIGKVDPNGNKTIDEDTKKDIETIRDFTSGVRKLIREITSLSIDGHGQHNSAPHAYLRRMNRMERVDQGKLRDSSALTLRSRVHVPERVYTKEDKEKGEALSDGGVKIGEKDRKITTEDTLAITRPISVHELADKPLPFNQIQLSSTDNGVAPIVQDNEHIHNLYIGSAAETLAGFLTETNSSAAYACNAVAQAMQNELNNPVTRPHFEGISMYSASDMLVQSADHQLINAGGEIVLTAAQGITLRVGNSFIKITEAGIEINNSTGRTDNPGAYPAYHPSEDAQCPHVMGASFPLGGKVWIDTSGVNMQGPYISSMALNMFSASTILGSSLSISDFSAQLHAPETCIYGGAALKDAAFNGIAKVVLGGASDILMSCYGVEAAVYDGPLEDGIKKYDTSSTDDFAGSAITAFSQFAGYAAGVGKMGENFKNLFSVSGSSIVLSPDKIKVTSKRSELTTENQAVRIGNQAVGYWAPACSAAKDIKWTDVLSDISDGLSAVGGLGAYWGAYYDEKKHGGTKWEEADYFTFENPSKKIQPASIRKTNKSRSRGGAIGLAAAAGAAIAYGLWVNKKVLQPLLDKIHTSYEETSRKLAQKKVARMNVTIADLKEQVKTEKKDVAKKEAAIRELEATIGSREEKIDESTSDITKSNTRAQTLNQELQTLKKSVQKKEERVSSLEGKVEVLQRKYGLVTVNS